jgi:hypothetical protein
MSNHLPVVDGSTGTVRATRLHPVVAPMTRSALHSRGTNDADIARQLRRGDWKTVRPGRYLTMPDYTAMGREDRHRALISAVIPDLGPGGVISHTSAAVMLGIDTWDVRLDRVHVSRRYRYGARASRWVSPHDVAEPLSTVLVGDVMVTTPARTVVDCARLVSFEQGVVITDSALRSGLVTVTELDRHLHAAAHKMGIARARTVVAFADARSESVGESRSRVLLRQSALPDLELQYRIRDVLGNDVARVDFAIPELKVAGEFDGKVKYGRLLRPGESAGDAVFEEKRREDAVRDLDWQVVRWVWAELAEPAVVIDRWNRAIERARRRDR